MIHREREKERGKIEIQITKYDRWYEFFFYQSEWKQKNNLPKRCSMKIIYMIEIVVWHSFIL